MCRGKKTKQTQQLKHWKKKKQFIISSRVWIVGIHWIFFYSKPFDCIFKPWNYSDLKISKAFFLLCSFLWVIASNFGLSGKDSWRSTFELIFEAWLRFLLGEKRAMTLAGCEKYAVSLASCQRWRMKGILKLKVHGCMLFLATFSVLVPAFTLSS